MSTDNRSFLERVIRAIARAARPQRHGETERRAPIRWVSLR
jgi:hypothetical protein